MRFGLFSVADHYPTELPRSTAELYGELLEQAEAADELGFDSFWLAEHHFHEYGAVPRPPIWMAAAAQRTRRIRLGSGVVVLPFDNPMRVAEDYAMVDVLSGGRLNLGVGSGYLRHELEGFGVSADDKRARFDEALEILLRAWTGEPVSFTDVHYQVNGVRINVRPLQEPRPPVWVATLRADGGARVGARGDGALRAHAAVRRAAPVRRADRAGRGGGGGSRRDRPRGAPLRGRGLHALPRHRELRRPPRQARPALDGADGTSRPAALRRRAARRVTPACGARRRLPGAGLSLAAGEWGTPGAPPALLLH
jgi:alkanesulfonate monooxygenase SsuD/methylene tetrahydromethanopterin reductase-like flavin-dependent oxidoreductase (luciferase family)